MKILFDYLELGASRSEGSVSASRIPMGYQAIAHGTLASATKLTVPANVNGYACGYVVIQCLGSASTDYLRWRDDGTAPTSSVGMTLFSSQELDYTGDPSAIQFIVGSGAPDMNVSYYA